MNASLQAETAAKMDALLDQAVKIDTSPFILSPFEAERKPALLARAFKAELWRPKISAYGHGFHL